MPTTQTSADLMPPKVPPLVATNWPEDIQRLGDAIAKLSVEKAQELKAYLESKKIVTPARVTESCNGKTAPSNS